MDIIFTTDSFCLQKMESNVFLQLCELFSALAFSWICVKEVLSLIGHKIGQFDNKLKLLGASQ